MKLRYIKQGSIQLIAVLLFTFAIAGCKSNSVKHNYVAVSDKTDIPLLLERQGALAQAVEWDKTKEKVAELRAKVEANPEDLKSRLQIATIYMNEGRITGDTYYHQAAMKILDGVLKIDGNNFEALTYKASIAMSLHRFAEAKELAEKARAINPANAYVYGVLVDANVELGNYQQAIQMSDTMQKLKPSLESYARASYLREINGDYPGAIEAMSLANQAGGQGSESEEWTRVALGNLYLNIGKLDSAKMLFETSLLYRPDFPTAYIGLANVASAQKQYDTAIKYTEKAIKVISETKFVQYLGELYELKGDKKKAGEIRADVIRLLNEAENENGDEIVLKHNGNRELATAYLDNGELDKALKFAQTDLALRPENIDANELVAWIYFLKGDYSNAKIHAEKMLATNTSNAQTLYKAGLIFSKAGDAAKGTELMAKAMTINPYIDPRITALK